MSVCVFVGLGVLADRVLLLIKTTETLSSVIYAPLTTGTFFRRLGFTI